MASGNMLCRLMQNGLHRKALCAIHAGTKRCFISRAAFHGLSLQSAIFPIRQLKRKISPCVRQDRFNCCHISSLASAVPDKTEVFQALALHKQVRAKLRKKSYDAAEEILIANPSSPIAKLLLADIMDSLYRAQKGARAVNIFLQYFSIASSDVDPESLLLLLQSANHSVPTLEYARAFKFAVNYVESQKVELKDVALLLLVQLQLKVPDVATPEHLVKILDICRKQNESAFSSFLPPQLLKSITKARKMHVAARFVTYVRENEITVDGDSYADALIEFYALSGDFANVSTLLDQIIEDRTMLSSSTRYAVATAFSTPSSLDSLDKFLEYCFLNSLLSKEVVAGTVQELTKHEMFDYIIELRAKFVNFGLPLDVTFYETLLSGLGKLGDVRRCEEMLAEMKAFNMQPTSPIYGAMISAYMCTGNVREAEEIARAARSQQVGGRDIEMALFNGYCAVGPLKKARKMMPTIVTAQYCKPAAAAATLLTAYVRKSQIEEALVIVKQYDYSPAVVVPYLDTCCECDRFDDAFLVTDQLMYNGQQPRVIYFSRIIGQATRKKLVEYIHLCVDLMIVLDFEFPPSFVKGVVKSYVECDEEAEAEKFLISQHNVLDQQSLLALAKLLISSTKRSSERSDDKEQFLQRLVAQGLITSEDKAVIEAETSLAEYKNDGS